MKRFFSRFCSAMAAEHGASVVETALALPILLLLLMGAIDFGRAYYLSTEIAGAAQAAVEYGSTNPSDTSGMQNAATSDAPDIPSLTVSTLSYGCECSDGSNYSANCSSMPTCSSNSVYVVNISVSATYKPWFPWPKIPSTIQLSQTASMRSSGD